MGNHSAAGPERMLGRRALATVAGVSVLATMTGTVVGLAPDAGATAAPGQDVFNDWGQTAAEVTAEINAAVDRDARVITARARYERSLVAFDAIKRVEATAVAAYRTALATAASSDDAAAKANLAAVRTRKYSAAFEVVNAHYAVSKVVDAVMAAVRSHHYIQAPYVALPTMPVNVTAVGASNQVTLAWDAVNGATTYRVFRDGRPLGDTIAAQYVDLTALNGNAYAYTIMAINVAGWSPISAEVVGTPAVTAPAVPTSLVASPGDSRVDLAWASSASATDYRVYRDGVLIASPSGTTYADSGLTNGQSYSYTVAAANGSAVSAPSTAVASIPVAAAPAAPTGLVASSGNNVVSLTWNASVGATNYTIYRNGSVLTSTAATTYNDSTAANGQTYSYYVVAFKQNSAPSAASSTVTGSPVAPPLATPSGLVATAGNAQVSLSWTAVSGATSYRVYRGLSGGALTLLSSPSGTSYVDSTAVNGQAYDYTVAAVGPSSTSAQSGKVTATPSAPVSGVPTGLSAQAGDTTVTLRWSAVSGATSYKVYRVGTATAIATTALLTYTDTALTNNTAYTYYVTAINGTESAASTQVTATPFVLTPSVPAGVLATAGDKQVVLSWTASTNAQSYKLYRDGALIASPTGTTATDTGLVNGVAHAYTVAAVNGSATSATSTPVSATPMAPAPAAPTGLVATAGDTTVALSWTAVANATSYHVYRGATLVGSPTGTTYTDTALVNNTLYSYTVKAVRDTTESPASTAVSATPKKPVIDGTYTGATAAIASGHGTINVVIVVTGGKITAASGNLLTFDGSETKGINTGNTVITGGALAAYATKTVAAQSTAITKVSGATLTFNAWKTSLQSALTQAGL